MMSGRLSLRTTILATAGMNRKTRIFALLGALALTSGAVAHGQEAQVRATGDRPRIGLVLSGDGASGAAHIGVLKDLEAQNVPADALDGPHSGAVVGCLD